MKMLSDEQIDKMCPKEWPHGPGRLFARMLIDRFCKINGIGEAQPWVGLTAILETLRAEDDFDSPVSSERKAGWFAALDAVEDKLREKNAAQPTADDKTGGEPPPECQTEAEKKAFAFGWWKALEKAPTPQAIAAEAKAKELDRCIRIIRAQMRRYKDAGKGVEAKAAERLSILIRRQDNAVRK